MMKTYTTYDGMITVEINVPTSMNTDTDATIQDLVDQRYLPVNNDLIEITFAARGGDTRVINVVEGWVTA